MLKTITCKTNPRSLVYVKDKGSNYKFEENIQIHSWDFDKTRYPIVLSEPHIIPI